MKTPWSIEDSLNAYQIKRWGLGYFGISNQGDLCVYPTKSPDGPVINIKNVIQELESEDVQFPVVLRFHDILRQQVTELNKCFQETIKEADFQGEYFGVYPIKVNQLREVVEEITDVGKEYNYGLEAGSKPELMAVLAYNHNPQALTILNGYKDKQYMELAMLGTLMGRNIIIVIEKLSEIHNVLAMAKTHHCEPVIGVRAKLATRAGGKWSESSGEFAKFGLSASEIFDLIDILKKEDKLDWLKLLHFHVGSQIPDIRNIKECITEGARIYCDLKKIGVNLQYFDAGGGVGVNYEGTNTNSPTSINYKLSDYIGDVVYILKDICDDNNIDHPHIVTETGRAVSAHHSCVITKVFGHVNLTNHRDMELNISDDDHMLLRNIKELYCDLNSNNYQDIYNDACTIKDEVISAYKLGILNLEERSIAETLYWNICHKVLDMTKDEKYIPVDIKKLKTTLADKYLCNFSLFQSAPDSWAIGQILPIVPISHHNQEPTNQCTLGDITCDSDGQVNSFLGSEGNQNTLPIHDLPVDEDYYIGFFLTGAYQDVMGDMHNMFGRLNEAHIFCDDDDPTDFYIEEIIHGNSAANVLEIMQYNTSELCRKVKFEIDARVKQGHIKPRKGVKLADFYEKCLQSYTYLKT